MKKFLKNQKGLTLVELLAVIVILGIIAAIAVPAIANIIDNSRKDAQIANAEALYDAARLAVVGENISASTDDTQIFYAIKSDNAGIDLEEEGYLDETPDNPMGDPYEDAFVEYDGDDYSITLIEENGGDIYFNGSLTIGQIRGEGRTGFDNPEAGGPIFGLTTP